CGEGGDVIKFIQSIEHISFVESVERLADRVGLRLTYEGGGASVQRDRGTRARMVEAHKSAQTFYAEQLASPDAQAARDFLKQRGFDAAAAQTFGCGFAPAGWDKLTKHLLNQGFELRELLTAGLAKEGRQGPIDRFHRRLVWPIRDVGNDVVGFGARRLFDDDRIEAKYLNTSESPIYKKSQVLFGLDLAKREISRRHQVVVVEGYTDVMAMHLAGVTTAVASCGTAFGTEHVSVLRRLIGDDSFDLGEMIYLFDGDQAGQAAAMKAFEGEQQFVGQTFVAVAPDGLDPCELRQRSGDTAVRDLVARREPLFEFAIRGLLRDYDLDTTEGQVGALRRTVPLVAQIKDRSLRDGYARRLAGWVGWADEATVVQRVRETAGVPTERPRAVGRNGAAQQNGAGNGSGNGSGNGAGNGSADGSARPAPDDPRLRLQREALKAALQVPAVAGPAYDELPAESFTHQAYVTVHQGIQAAGGSAAGLEGPEWLEAVTTHCPSTLRTLITELAVEPLRMATKHDGAPRYVGSVLAGLQGAMVERQVAELKSRLQRTSPVTEADEYHALFGDLVALEQYRKALRERSLGTA
ncbi:MAG TPA: DNA primase, partial [Pseudonocardia sp.]|uniref:DNA primase n=1 Tax=Pseudonocardia sp. TaxID=60912 RepID=UPI002EDAEAA3